MRHAVAFFAKIFLKQFRHLHNDIMWLFLKTQDEHKLQRLTQDSFLNINYLSTCPRSCGKGIELWAFRSWDKCLSTEPSARATISYHFVAGEKDSMQCSLGFRIPFITSEETDMFFVIVSSRSRSIYSICEW